MAAMMHYIGTSGGNSFYMNDSSSFDIHKLSNAGFQRKRNDAFNSLIDRKQKETEKSLNELMSKTFKDGRLADAIFDSSSVSDRLSHGRIVDIDDGWIRPYKTSKLELKWML